MTAVRTSPKALLVALTLVTSFVLAGCGEDEALQAERARGIDAVDVADLGDVLVDGKGAVLYIFEPDEAETVSCTLSCESNWPPLEAVDGGTPEGTDNLDADLLGTLPKPGGGEVITYNGWPLYRYAADNQPGEAKGQAKYLNGGDWYVMKPDGEPLIP
jgi:predicted lipoprotein with Yx(FWY)xxD motif